MKFLELSLKRYSVRKYLRKPVEREKLLNCIEAARLAPSACNSQPWHFVLVDDPEKVKNLAIQTTLPLTKLNRFVEQSPVIAALVAENPNLSSGLGGMVKKKPYYLIDIGIAAEHFCLQAAEEGLGTCMLGWFNERAVKKFLKVPSSKSIPLLISIGYPETVNPPEKVRTSLEKIYSLDSYK